MWSKTLITVLIAIQANVLLAACPSGWTSYSTECIKYVGISKNNANARSYCASLSSGATLVSIKDAGKNAIVSNLLSESFTWIGLRDNQAEGTFRWDFDNSVLGPYTNWDGNEPNNYGSGEDCAEINGPGQSSFGKWNDRDCPSSRHFICEVEMSTVAPTAAPTVHPTPSPSAVPSVEPTFPPSLAPSSRPSSHPSTAPTGVPSGLPSGQPSGEPTAQPNKNLGSNAYKPLPTTKR